MRMSRSLSVQRITVQRAVIMDLLRLGLLIMLRIAIVLNMACDRVIVIVVMIAAAVGIYYYIAGKIRKSRKK